MLINNCTLFLQLNVIYLFGETFLNISKLFLTHSHVFKRFGRKGLLIGLRMHGLSRSIDSLC